MDGKRKIPGVKYLGKSGENGEKKLGTKKEIKWKQWAKKSSNLGNILGKGLGKKDREWKLYEMCAGMRNNRKISRRGEN